MKKTTILTGLAILLLAGAMIFTGCKKEVESLDVDPVSIVLAVGEEYRLSADVRPKNAPQDVEWYTTNPHVAAVDGNGVVTALKIGVCNIKLYAGASAAACQVTVVRKRVEHFFSVNDLGDRLQFAPGNLQYQASTNTWRFAEHQYEYVGGSGKNAGNVPGSDNLLVSPRYDGWIDLFSWATSGWHDVRDSLNIYYRPWDINFDPIPAPEHNRYGFGPSRFMPDVNLTGSSARYDWGVCNPIYNPQTKTTDSAGTWRLPTFDERQYIFFNRTTASGVRFSRAVVHGVNGFVVFPDDWDMNIRIFKDPNITSGYFGKNVLEDDEWILCEAEGCVFLPCMGDYTRITYQGEVAASSLSWRANNADYWTSTAMPEKTSWVYTMFQGPYGRCSTDKLSVRLIRMFRK